MEIIFTPWRYKYVSTSDEATDCVFCKIIESPDDSGNLVLSRSRHNLVVLNRYPYTSGHLMVAPLRHLSEPADARAEEIDEMMALSVKAMEILRRELRAEGFNVGMNVGRVAGAGVEHHYHMHVIPRWGGDTSFVTLTGDARVIPQKLDETFRLLQPAFAII